MNEASEVTAPKFLSARRKMRVMLPFLVVLACISLLVVASLVANRPHWRTLAEPVTLTGSAATGGHVVTMACPDDWVLTDHGQMAGGPGRLLTLQRRTPTGLMRWWNEHVFPVHNHPANRTQIMVCVYSTNGIKKPGMKMDINSLERALRSMPRSQTGFRLTAGRMPHPLGPALAVQIDRSTPPGIHGAPQNVSFMPQHDESFYICPAHEKEDDIAWITLTCSAPQSEYPRLKPMFDKVMQSVRLR